MLRAWSSLYLTSRGLCTKNLSQQAKLCIPGSTATFCGDCVKTCEDVAPNFGENRPGCFTMTTPRLTLPSSPSSLWRKTKLLSSHTHRTPLIRHRVTSISKNEIEAEMTPVWYHWGDTDRIAESAWHSDRKGLPGSVSKMEKRLGPVSTCGGNYFEGDGGRYALWWVLRVLQRQSRKFWIPPYTSYLLVIQLLFVWFLTFI
jgi:hypothetical protein